MNPVVISRVRRRRIVHVNLPVRPSKIPKSKRTNVDGSNTHYHFTDTTTFASDNHAFTLDTEEILSVEGGGTRVLIDYPSSGIELPKKRWTLAEFRL